MKSDHYYFKDCYCICKLLNISESNIPVLKWRCKIIDNIDDNESREFLLNNKDGKEPLAIKSMTVPCFYKNNDYQSILKRITNSKIQVETEIEK